MACFSKIVPGNLPTEGAVCFLSSSWCTHFLFLSLFSIIFDLSKGKLLQVLLGMYVNMMHAAPGTC